MQSSKKPQIVAKGDLGNILELYDDHIKIIKKGIFNFASDSRSAQEIQIKNITSIEWIKPSMMGRPYIRFSYPGAPTPTGDHMKDMNAPNTVVAGTWGKNDEIEAILVRIEQIRLSSGNLPTASDAIATKDCPMCAETVKAEAKICRYCRHQF
jgi:hypothetical protein